VSVDLSGEITAIATAALAGFAIVTAIVAALAFWKQSREVRAIERQVIDQQEISRQQAELLKIQSDQLELQRQQLDDQHAAIEDQIRANARQAEVLELQASELRASLEQRERAADEQRRMQAVMVTAFLAEDHRDTWGARVCNDSSLPVVDVRTFFNYVAEKPTEGDQEPRMLGGPAEKIRILPPHADRFVEIPEQVRNQMSEVSDSQYAVSIEFTDAAGNHWERDPRGALVPRS